MIFSAVRDMPFSASLLFLDGLPFLPSGWVEKVGNRREKLRLSFCREHHRRVPFRARFAQIFPCTTHEIQPYGQARSHRNRGGVRMKLAVVYARYSSEKQNDQSIEGQLDVCQRYAAQNGLEIVDTYIDRAMSGTIDQRPAFQQMLADCTKPVPWDIILVYAIDRFGRNSIEIAVNKQKIKKNHKTLISATQRTSENIDGSKNLDGILLENMYIGLAEYYSAELSQKVRRGFHENRKKGLFCGGKYYLRLSRGK